MFRFAFLISCALLSSMSGLKAQDAKPIKVTDAYAIATPAFAKTGAAYVTITNSGSRPDRLLRVSTPAAERAEIHEMTMTGSVMQMRQLTNGVTIAPGKSVTFKPGGIHIMLFSPVNNFEANTEFNLTLEFEKAGAIEVTIPIQAMGAHKNGTK